MSNLPSPEAMQFVKKLMSMPGNCLCADCQQKSSRWASLNLGIFICIDCSGIHRSLGTHVSFVRSCELDSWTPSQALQMKKNGNVKANEFWEANLPPNFQRPRCGDRAAMEKFIRQKYIEKRWAASSFNSPSLETQHQIIEHNPKEDLPTNQTSFNFYNNNEKWNDENEDKKEYFSENVPDRVPQRRIERPAKRIQPIIKEKKPKKQNPPKQIPESNSQSDSVFEMLNNMDMQSSSIETKTEIPSPQNSIEKEKQELNPQDNYSVFNFLNNMSSSPNNDSMHNDPEKEEQSIAIKNEDKISFQPKITKETVLEEELNIKEGYYLNEDSESPSQERDKNENEISKDVCYNETNSNSFSKTFNGSNSKTYENDKGSTYDLPFNKIKDEFDINEIGFSMVADVHNYENIWVKTYDVIDLVWPSENVEDDETFELSFLLNPDESPYKPEDESPYKLEDETGNSIQPSLQDNMFANLQITQPQSKKSASKVAKKDTFNNQSGNNINKLLKSKKHPQPQQSHIQIQHYQPPPLSTINPEMVDDPYYKNIYNQQESEFLTNKNYPQSSKTESNDDYGTPIGEQKKKKKFKIELPFSIGKEKENRPEKEESNEKKVWNGIKTLFQGDKEEKQKQSDQKIFLDDQSYF